MTLDLRLDLSALAGLATLLLVFPGYMLYTMWFVATPVCVVEQLGPLASMERSRMLTQGHRWKIFGMLILLSLIFLPVGSCSRLGDLITQAKARPAL